MKKAQQAPLSTAGAGAALAWIEKQEAEGRKQVEELQKVLSMAIAVRQNLKDDEAESSFADKAVRRAQQDLDDAEDRHSKRLKQLREFDRSVSDDKRSAEETITREEGAKLVQTLLIYLRQGNQRLMECVPAIRECKTNEEGYAAVEKAYAREFANAVELGVKEQHLPGWVKQAASAVI